MKSKKIKYWEIELFEAPKPHRFSLDAIPNIPVRTPFFRGYSKTPISSNNLSDEKFITLAVFPEALDTKSVRVDQIFEVKCSPIYESEKSFNEAAEPLIKWLAENVHPHHSAIVTRTDAELLSSEVCHRTEEFLKD